MESNSTVLNKPNVDDKENRENVISITSVRPCSGLKKKAKCTLPEPTEDIEEYFEILAEHQKNCEKSGKYVEAEMAKRRLAELKQEIDRRNKDEMKQRHKNEKDEIEKAHFSEFQEFNEFWDKKMQEFNEEAAKVEEQTVQRQQDELKKFQDELENSIPAKPKDTPELLSLRKAEESLAKQQEYMEAHKIQQRVLQIEKEEFEKWTTSRNTKIRNLISQLKLRQVNEYSALKQRIISGQEEQRKVRSLELEKLLQKYTNVRKELEVSQNQEVSKLDKSIKNTSVMNMSRMMNQSKMSNASFVKVNQKGNVDF